MTVMPMSPQPDSPFNLDGGDIYQTWRAHKLEHSVTEIDQLVVEVNNPGNLREAEKSALMQRIQNCNMALYASALDRHEDKGMARLLGRQ